MIDLQFKRGHGRVEMYPVEIVQEQDLRVPLPSIARFGCLGRLADFYHDNVAAISVAVEGEETYGTTWPSCS